MCFLHPDVWDFLPRKGHPALGAPALLPPPPPQSLSLAHAGLLPGAHSALLLPAFFTGSWSWCPEALPLSADQIQLSPPPHPEWLCPHPQPPAEGRPVK